MLLVMPNNVVHFDISADDLARARRFYERVFGWKFHAWGPPDFFLIRSGTKKDPGIHGALTHRHTSADGPIGFECTIAVEDIDACAKAIEANGGKVVFPKTEIHGVGRIIQFHDTEGNVVSAMQYDGDPNLLPGID
jgi:predicted enzyme related to lactoylglutathione lyase